MVPIGAADVHKVHGRHARKPWEYEITAAIPHLDTIDPLKACIATLRAQSVAPYIMVVDTGSPPQICAQLEALRGPDLEIHYIAGHGFQHSSELVTVALDVAQTLCRSKLLFHTHADCFLRRRDFLENVARITNANTPAVGYRMSPRDWITNEWEWMVGHTALMLYMPSIHRAGATWSMQRMVHAYGYGWGDGNGWPDTETGFNHALRDAGIKPVFIGHDRNYERQFDDNIDHVRSYPGAKQYSPEHLAKMTQPMEEAMREAHARVAEWTKRDC